MNCVWASHKGIITSTHFETRNGLVSLWSRSSEAHPTRLLGLDRRDHVMGLVPNVAVVSIVLIDYPCLTSGRF